MIIKEKTNWKKMYDELYEIRIQDLKDLEKRFVEAIKKLKEYFNSDRQVEKINKIMGNFNHSLQENNGDTHTHQLCRGTHREEGNVSNGNDFTTEDTHAQKFSKLLKDKGLKPSDFKEDIHVQKDKGCGKEVWIKGNKDGEPVKSAGQQTDYDIKF